MVKFSGSQQSSVLTLTQNILTLLDDIELSAFEFNDNFDEMFFWDIGELPPTKKPPASEKPFKPRNNQLSNDYAFWSFFIEERIRAVFQTAIVDIPLIQYNTILNGINQMEGWCSMVSNAYLTDDIPVYHNVIYNRRKTLGFYTSTERIVLDPTPTINQNSKLCKIQTALQGKRQVYFIVEPYREKIETIRNDIQSLISVLEAPTPEQTDIVTGVAIDAEGTKKIIQTILNFSVNVTSTFKKTIGLIEKASALASYILLFLREDTKEDLRDITMLLEFVLGGNPEEIGTTSLNEIRYIWLVGSEGNYYPVPPVESTDLDNDVYLSMSNGILAGLKRADENARWRYQRVNNALFEVTTNTNINKAYLDDLSPRILDMQNKIIDIQTKIINQETEIETINTKLDLIITELNTLNNR